ncbi:MAG: tripartite tricarboxylate transporter TctB family protein [Thermodesulfobacteriota bacterium]
MRGSLIFTAALLLASFLLLKATLPYPFKAKLFPLIVLITVLVLLMIQVFREAFALKKRATAETEKGEKFRWKHVAVFFWMAGTVLMLWILGFMATVVLLPFFYLRYERERWLLSICLSLGCGVFFYGLFGYLLNMPLYPGILFGKF